MKLQKTEEIKVGRERIRIIKRHKGKEVGGGRIKMRSMENRTEQKQCNQLRCEVLLQKLGDYVQHACTGDAKRGKGSCREERACVRCGMSRL